MKHTRDRLGNKALEILENMEHGNLFLTGKAGTGKSTLINDFVDSHPELNILLMAPTGIAAQNIGGMTIHNAMRFNTNTTASNLPNLSMDRTNFLAAADVIIIDEISMVPAHLMDCIDIRLRQVGDWRKPFGGKKMVFVGDLYQLPPVVDGFNDKRVKEVYQGTYTTRFFYGSKVFQKEGRKDWTVIELEHVYRQEEGSDFLEILNCIREGKQEQRVVDRLNERVGAEVKHSIILTTTNRNADKINEEQSLAKHRTFNFFLTTDYKLIEENIRTKEQEWMNAKMLKELSPFDNCIKVRHGDQIIITINQQRPESERDNIDWKPDYVNGDMGEFITYKEGLPNLCYIRLYKDGKIRAIKKQDVTITQPVLIGARYENEPIGIVRGYPFKRAYAITMHKSQGQTYNSAILDFEKGPFECGQTYVALSRIKTFEGLSLTSPIKKEYIFADEDVVEFLNTHKFK